MQPLTTMDTMKAPLRFIPFIVYSEIQACAEEMDLVLANLIAQ
jgi:hypothetical protein